MSLKDLKPKFEPKSSRVPKKSPDLNALRDVLKDSLEEAKSSVEADDRPTHPNTNSGEFRDEKESQPEAGQPRAEKKKVLKPGDSIKF